ncbi:MAG: 2-amino-4-hydroxy-6-hydroxymethyldihydropteridine diphosphokinase [Fibrobacterota bacterium]
MAKVVLSLGSNLGDRYYYMHRMKSLLEEVLSYSYSSCLYETEPVDVGPDHSAYLNCLVAGFYYDSPRNLLDLVEGFEKKLGRTEKGSLKPRVADIDILLFEGVCMESPRLSIPHPALFRRRFILEGLRELVPHWSIRGNTCFGDYIAPRNILQQNIQIIDG